MKPLLLLDIDGVLNAASVNPPTHAWPRDAWRRVRVDGFWLHVAQPVIDFLIGLDGSAEIRWHTTWQDRALHVGEVFGLPPFGVQEAPEFLHQGETLKLGSWWKLPAVWRELATGRPVIWADDDIDTELTEEQRLSLLAHTNVLRICPDHRTGLCPKHLLHINRFLEQRS